MRTTDCAAKFYEIKNTLYKKNAAAILLLFFVSITFMTTPTLAKGPDLFKFSNGNTLSYVNDEAVAPRDLNYQDHSMVAVFNTSGEKLSKNYFFLLRKNTRKLFYEKYALLADDDPWEPAVVDENGEGRRLKRGGKLKIRVSITSALEIGSAQNSDLIAASYNGVLYKINLNAAEIIDEDKTFKGDDIELARSATNQLLVLQGYCSGYVSQCLVVAEQLHFVSGASFPIQITNSFDFKNLTKEDTKTYFATKNIHYFPNGSMTLFNNSGGMAFISRRAELKVFSGEGFFSNALFDEELEYRDLRWLNDGRLMYIGDSLGIHTIDQYGDFRVFSPNFEKIKSFQNNLNSKKTQKVEYEIKNPDAGCLPVYLSKLSELRKERASNIVKSIIFVGICMGVCIPVLISNGEYIGQWSKEDHLVMTIKVLDDAEEYNASPEINALAQSLIQFAPHRFYSVAAVMTEIRKLNHSRAACEKHGKYSPATLKDLMYRLVLL